jgi:hypothetical protein
LIRVHLRLKSGFVMRRRFAAAAPFLIALVYSAQQTRDTSLVVRIFDASTGKATPARVLLTDLGGNAPKEAPNGAVGVMWGRSDRAEGFVFQPDGSFYADGRFEATLPPGSYTLAVSKGYEYLKQTQKVELEPGKALSRDIRLERWINMPERGWYSADDHIHVQRSPRDDPHLLRWIAAEDLHVGNILEMGDFWSTYFTQHAFGAQGRYREGGHILSPGQEEPRTPEIGHTISLGAKEMVRFREDYYNYGRVFDRIHELGGISGFAHQAVTFAGYRGMVLTAPLGKVDFLELVQFCAPNGPLAIENYYHWLDLGIPLTALAGSDFPWCGRGPRYGVEKGSTQIGDARFYTYTGRPFDFEGWFSAVKSGRTFATTGPILELTVNGRLPGETIEAEPGTKLRIAAKAYGHESQVPLSGLEVVVHGEVVRQSGGSRRQLAIDMEMPVERGLWVAARCTAGPSQQAHTTPVYVRVNGGGFHNPKTAARYLEASEKYLQELETVLRQPGGRLGEEAGRHAGALTRQITEARQELARLAGRLQARAGR